MADNQPIDQTGAEAVVASPGFATGSNFDALLQGVGATAKAKEAADRHEAGQEALNSASASLTEDFDKFIAALKRALGDSISKTSYDTAHANGSLEQVSQSVTVTGGIDGYAEFTANNGGSTYYVTEEGVFHKDKDGVISPEEAFNSATLINMNAKAHIEGITISGNDQQKAMYYMGYLDLQNTLGDAAPKLNNIDEMKALPEAVRLQAAQEYAAFKAQQATENEAKLTLDKNALDAVISELNPPAGETLIAGNDATFINSAIPTSELPIPADFEQALKNSTPSLLDETIKETAFSTAPETLTDPEINHVEGGFTQDATPHLFGSGKYEFGEQLTAGLDIEEPKVRPIQGLPDGVYGVVGADGEAQFFTTNPQDQRELWPEELEAFLEAQHPAGSVPEDEIIETLSEEDRAALIERTVAQKRATDPRATKAMQHGLGDASPSDADIIAAKITDAVNGRDKTIGNPKAEPSDALAEKITSAVNGTKAPDRTLISTADQVHKAWPNILAPTGRINDDVKPTTIVLSAKEAALPKGLFQAGDTLFTTKPSPLRLKEEWRVADNGLTIGENVSRLETAAAGAGLGGNSALEDLVENASTPKTATETTAPSAADAERLYAATALAGLGGNDGLLDIEDDQAVLAAETKSAFSGAAVGTRLASAVSSVKSWLPSRSANGPAAQA